MRKFLWYLLTAVFLPAILLPMHVRAESRDGVRIEENGTVTIVSQHAAKEGISSLGFGLMVESENTVRVEFRFEVGKAEIMEFRYDEAAGRLNIYIAGTEALFAEGTDSLVIGRIIILDESGRETSANVSVVEDSLQYVYGTELRTMEEIELPGVVQVGAANNTPTDEDASPGEETPTDEDTSSGEETPTDEDTSSGEETPPDAEKTPEATQPPAVTQKPAVPQAPTATNAPAISKLPVVTPQPSPTPNATETPQAMETPSPSQNPADEGTGNGSGQSGSSAGSISGIDQTAGQMTDDKKEPQGMNKAFVIVVVVILLAVAGGIAYIVWKKKTKDTAD